MMKLTKITVLALSALLFWEFAAAGTESAAPAPLGASGPTSANAFSSDDVSAFDQVYVQYLRDHKNFIDIAGRFVDDKGDFWFKCFQFHEPALTALGEHLKETEELLRLSTKMENRADEARVLGSLLLPLSDAQSDIMGIRPYMDGLAKCSTDPRFSEGHAALDNATRPVADALDQLFARWKEVRKTYPIARP